MKIGFLIPSTSINMPWTTIEDSYLWTYMLKTLKETKTDNYTYIIYIGVDKDDNIYNNNLEIEKLKKEWETDDMQIRHIQFPNIEKGYLTAMWNYLFDIAYNEGCNYFYQCGDDIMFKNKGWLLPCINILQKHGNIGVSGPLQRVPQLSRTILTQSLVSRKHKEIFGYYFPPEIKNWHCDDWITQVYSIGFLFIFKDLTITNSAISIRYKTPKLHYKNDWGQNQVLWETNKKNNVKSIFKLINKQLPFHRQKIINYIRSNRQ